MQSEPNFKLLTPFWYGCQQQNLSKNLLWVAGCLSNKLTLICQGVFKLASNAALLCKSLAFVCEIKIIVKASNKYFIRCLFNRLNERRPGHTFSCPALVMAGPRKKLSKGQSSAAYSLPRYLNEILNFVL